MRKGLLFDDERYDESDDESDDKSDDESDDESDDKSDDESDGKDMPAARRRMAEHEDAEAVTMVDSIVNHEDARGRPVQDRRA